MIENKKNIIFCLSYLSVPWTLQIIEDKGYKNCLIITNIESIEKLFVELYISEIVYSTKKSGRYILFLKDLNPLKYIAKLFLTIYYKRKEKRIFKNVAEKNIYFFFTAFGILESYLIKQLSKKNNIFYLPDVKMDSFDRDNSIISKINKIVIKLFYKFDVNTLKNGQTKVFAVSNNFLENINVQNFQLPNNLLTVKNKIQKYYNLNSAKILFLASGFIVNNEFVNKAEYMTKTNRLLDYLKNKFGEKAIAIKTHPRFNKKYGEENNFYEIPYYIPGNLIINNFDIVVGYSSALLFEFANENKIVYSILDYYKSNTKTDPYKNYLNKNLNKNKHIIYIKNETEINNYDFS